MRQKTEILSGYVCDEKFNKSGGGPLSVNTAIIVELLMDIRQIVAAQFVITNGGTIPTPHWLEDIAKGE